MKKIILHSIVILFVGIVLVFILLALFTYPAVDLSILSFQYTETPTVSPEISPTHTQEITPTPLPSLTPTPTQQPTLCLWYANEIPVTFQESLTLTENVVFVSKKDEADVNLIVSPVSGNAVVAQWIYVLVAPFPTVVDEVSGDEIRTIWSGGDVEGDISKKILVTEETKRIFTVIWGKPSSSNIIQVKEDELLDLAWNWRNYYAIIPFEKLNPRWKVLRIDGQSPIDKQFRIDEYSLTVNLEVLGEEMAVARFRELSQNGTLGFLKSNRDPQKLTVVAMTGTTALTRDTAAVMDQKGVSYPGEDIQLWLSEADITHISNEVAFAADCPDAIFGKKTYQFCSKIEYFDLLILVGADVIELTGNHLMDWGREPLIETIEMYDQAGMQYYGGGFNLEDARKVVKMEHNGNRIAFLGCNAAGPASVWATETEPGANPCDRTWLADELQGLSKEGYLPIVTFQHIEQCSMEPHIYHRSDSIFAVDSGAVAVSGSQAHCPQKFEFRRNSFIHYGLGNLFFDQMDDVSRREFIDRYIFYDGKLVSVELLTAMLEDYSRPRPMILQERRYFLYQIFAASGWE